MSEYVTIGELHDLWKRPWWPVAQAIAATNTDCTVLDPDATDHAHWYDGKGIITVIPCCALGWTIVVTEVEPDVEDDG